MSAHRIGDRGRNIRRLMQATLWLAGHGNRVPSGVAIQERFGVPESTALIWRRAWLAVRTPTPTRDDDLPPCVAEKFGDIAHDIHRSAMEIDQ